MCYLCRALITPICLDCGVAICEDVNQSNEHVSIPGNGPDGRMLCAMCARHYEPETPDQAHGANHADE